MKALVIQNAPSTGIGLVGEQLRARGFALDIRDAQHTDFDAIDLGSADLFVILGSPRGVYERDVPWIEAEFRFTRRVLDADRPLWGICFGAQMIASALGAKVAPMGVRHRFWRENDMVVGEAWRGPWLRWHGDQFEVPPGAELLAMSQGVPQGFQRGRAVGVQFHPEVDADMVRAWVKEGQEGLKQDDCDGEALVAASIRECRDVAARLDLLTADILQRCIR
ncbi:glutamine amidotransferase [Azorhizobium oxalatiphilum]|uniref:Glutamine amidotransferase n=1 Tax=Azorhizobium oxalatiphilum TaxID=980631 RepID=A0A917C4X9_9HYPH|nr:type 1 glutamine amidotransferase [Azorhizobium oxalatiphilum]GGF68166.1 glutamine amidotransferase [Azorhizobium oxalatiphilum]